MWCSRIAILSVLTAACTADVSNPWSGTIDTLPSGAIHVSNPEQGLWGDKPLWRLAEVAKIGTQLDSGPELFGDISDIDVDPYGRIYVFDRQAHDVRVFEADGSYIRTTGRRGGGPGEFRVANGITVDPAGRLWVLNRGNLRYSVFDTSGALLMEPRRLLSSVRFVNWTSVFTPDGNLHEIVGYRSSMGTTFGLARYDTIAQRLVDTVPQPPFPEGTKFGSAVRTLTPNGWWQGVAHTYRLSNIGFSGDTVRVIELAREADRLSATERDSAERYEREMRQRVVRGEFDVETSRRPIIQKLVMDDLDHLWVMLSAEPEHDGTRFDVFDPIGRYLGQLAAPHVVDRWVLPIVRRDRIYYVTKDELDVPYVVAAEIRGRH
jgi:hypothetical protein